MLNHLKIIGFDADDTLWNNETFFREAEYEFVNLLKDYAAPDEIQKLLFKTEMQNLELYGYGIKSFVLSMIETASILTSHNLPGIITEHILDIGKQMLHQPVKLLESVEETLDKLNGKYRLVVATKGDLLDQQRKLKKSGLGKYFHHIEIMTDKRVADYQKLLHHLETAPSDFLMAGNSIKSDILPVINLGGYALHIPHHTTWQFEDISDEQITGYFRGKKLIDLLEYVYT